MILSFLEMVWNDEMMEFFGSEGEESFDEGIQGLSFLHRRLSISECNLILDQMANDSWFKEHNQVMRFGQLPNWIPDLETISTEIFPKEIATR